MIALSAFSEQTLFAFSNKSLRAMIGSLSTKERGLTYQQNIIKDPIGDSIGGRSRQNNIKL